MDKYIWVFILYQRVWSCTKFYLLEQFEGGVCTCWVHAYHTRIGSSCLYSIELDSTFQIVFCNFFHDVVFMFLRYLRWYLRRGCSSLIYFGNFVHVGLAFFSGKSLHTIYSRPGWRHVRWTVRKRSKWMALKVYKRTSVNKWNWRNSKKQFNHSRLHSKTLTKKKYVGWINHLKQFRNFGNK